MTLINRIGADPRALLARCIRPIMLSTAVIWLAHLSAPLWGQWPASGGFPGWTGGNVGIGTPAPANVLSVQKDQNGATFIDLTNSTNGPYASANVRVINDVGTSAYLGIYSSGGVPSGSLAAGNPYLYTTATGLTLMANNASGVLKFATGGITERMRIDSSGSVSIGTTNASQCGASYTPPCLLTVNGAMAAKEVIVTNGITADYVFKPGYRLRPLTEVASFIQEHHHLPEIPSEAEVKENGISVGDMQVKLLAKVEELTLHMIQADERNNRLEERSNRVERQNRELRIRIGQLEARKRIEK